MFGGKAQGIISGKLIAKGNFYFNGGDYNLDKAAKWYKVAAFADRKASLPRYQLARIYYLNADYKNALEEIDKALSLNPENKRAFYIRGLINGYVENYKAAEDDFQKFIAWAPKEWAGYNDLAWAYYQDKDYQNAADAAVKGLKVAPANAWLLNGLGVSYQALGENAKAKDALEKSAEIAKNMTAADWKRAYPGNDAQTTQWDLAQFKTDVNYNLNLSSYNLPSGQGKFAAACGSSNATTCGNGACDTSTVCDPDHAVHRLPQCPPPGVCWRDSDCCLITFTPDPIVISGSSFPQTGTAAVHVSNVSDCRRTSISFSSSERHFMINPSSIQHLDSSCSGNFTVNRGQRASSTSTTITATVMSSFEGGTSCVGTVQAGIGLTAPVNNNPTISISSPANGASGIATPAVFTASITDTDAGDTLVYNQTLTCGGNPQSINNPSSGSGNSPIAVSFTQSLPEGTSCVWTINANDNRGGSGSGQSTFTVASALPSCPNGTCGTGEDCDNCPTDCGICPSPCSCGNADGGIICDGQWPADSKLCSSGSAINKTPGGIYGDWEWSCCSGAVNCSAQGRINCGWIETNP